MSLNGLEDSLILTASEIAGGEPEGWMLLKYASRDEVELHATGFGGFDEMRESIANFKDESPLYGFLNYREKKIILKYQPEECSRLVQARATVHFGMICERFQPYDHTYEISEATQLKDSRLAAACALEPLVPSTPSSPQRRRRLGEISEEDDADADADEHPATRRKSAHFDSDENDERPKSPISGPPVTLNSDLAHSPEASKFSPTDQPPTFVGADLDPGDSSLQATRSADLYPYPSYKPKVKLGPRPSEASTRPGSSSSTNIRPISSLPAGFKASKAKKEKKHREKDLDKLAESPEITAGASLGSLSSGNRPHTSSGSSAISITSSMIPPPPSPTASLPVAKDRITPEKARLMKAMKLREKRMNKASASAEKTDGVPDSLKPHDDEDAETDGLSQLEADETLGVEGEACIQEESEASIQVETNAPSQTELNAAVQIEGQEDSRPAINHADSGIVIDAVPSRDDQASELTHSESHPPSPTLETSETANSTKASSISEVTETAQTNEDKEKMVLETEVEAETKIKAEAQAHAEQQPKVEEIEAEESKVATPVAEKPVALEPIPTDVPEPTVMEFKEEFNVEEPAVSGVKIEEAKTEETNIKDLHIQPLSEQTHDTSVLSSVQEESSPAELTAPRAPANAPVDSIECPVSPTTVAPSMKNTEATKTKHRPTEPIQTNLKIEQSELKVHADLKEKTSYEKIVEVEEQAKRLSMTMNQTPVTPLFPAPSLRSSSPSRPYSSCSTRTVSQPALRSSSVVALPADVTASSARSVSSGAGAAYLHKITQQSSNTLATKSTGKLGSSISQRIKALEQKSTSISGGAPSSSMSRPTTSSTFYSVRKSIGVDPAQSPALSAAGGLGRSPSRRSRDSVALGSGSRDRSSSVASRMSRFELDRIESSVQVQVQVTTRIVRDPFQDGACDEAEYNGQGEEYGEGREYDESRECECGDETSKRHVRAPSGEDTQNPTVADQEARTQNQNPAALDGLPPTATLQQRLSTLNHELSPALGLNRAHSPVRTSFHERRISKELNRRADEETEVSESLDAERRYAHVEKLRTGSATLTTSSSTATGSGLQHESPENEGQDGLSPLASPSSPTSEGGGFGRRSSLTFVKDLIKDRRRSLTANDRSGPGPSSSSSPARPANVFQNATPTSYMRRLSISSRRSSFSRDSNDASRSPTHAEIGSGDDADKKLGKAGRFMQRLSSGFSATAARVGKAQVTVTPTVQEETIASMGSAAVKARPKLKPTGEPEVTFMGDVNVQFPDNLLWKRRTMGLDTLGFLILTPVTASTARADKLGGASLKRFHLSDFKKPYVPDMELQELPNSVCLDFVEGSSLQIACEDRNGQMTVLNVLQAAYQIHGN
ncbi:hypothetical protein TD95_005231 [Thielaviopsis punctulata]|uniref:ADF-H domain-containing protein n=1 Tax=Thielaviopsis punctulata TaxID=72032 RepID=A0A0F4ZEY4_9PEZI|nr:hypothetical protein TD95_005231 [Thielaviopsis punctulata]